MHLRARRILGWAFIASFLLIAPAIIFSTAGYRYNFGKRRIERTGVMVLESRPQGASIFLNGVLRKETTPAHLSGLLPGTYDVRVEKPGYHAWEKNVPIESRSTSFVTQIGLFRQTLPTLYSPMSKPIRPAFSPDGRYGAAMTETSSGSELAIIDLKTGKAVLPYRSSAEAETFRLSWSQDGNWLLIAHEEKKPSFLLWGARSPEHVRDLRTDHAALALEHADWEKGASRLHGQAGGTMYAIVPETLEATPEGPSIDEAIVADGDVYGIQAGPPARLARRKLKADTFEPIAELPSAAFHPFPDSDGHVAYASPAGNDFFVVDPSGDRPKAFETRGKGAAWSSDGTKLLYWSDFEVRIRDTKSGSDDLITRLSEPIGSSAWHHPESGVIYATGSGLSAAEASDRYGRLTVPLATFTVIEKFAIDATGDTAYVFGEKEGRTGLWKLRLK